MSKIKLTDSPCVFICLEDEEGCWDSSGRDTVSRFCSFVGKEIPEACTISSGSKLYRGFMNPSDAERARLWLQANSVE